MDVLSLFDGMSGTQIALERIGIDVNKYYASEVDKYAIAVTQYNYPNTIQLGDINNWREWDIDWSSIDLIVGGSPCQGLSQAGRGAGLEDSRSKLFFVFVNILEHVKNINPNVFFLLENVVPKKREWAQNMTAVIGVEPIMIDSALVSAQSRKRFYWTNLINVSIPDNLSISPGDIIEENNIPNSDGWQKWWLENSEHQLKKKYSCIINNEPKAICATARQVSSWNGNLVNTKNGLRFITPVECERLQTVPDNYTSMGDFNGSIKNISNTQRYKMLGNGFTVDVIAHILKNIKEEQCN